MNTHKKERHQMKSLDKMLPKDGKINPRGGVKGQPINLTSTYFSNLSESIF